MSTFKALMDDGAIVPVPESPPLAVRGGPASPWPTAIVTAVGLTLASTLVMILTERRAKKKAAGELSAVQGAIVTTPDAMAVKSKMLPGTEYLVDLAFELAPKYGYDPLTVLAITKHESNWGLALTPKGPGGTGDFIARKDTPERRALAQRMNFPVAIAGGKIKPTQRGWGHGLYQIDLGSHEKFIATGKWSDPREAMNYMLSSVLVPYRDQIKKAFPNLAPADLLYANIAAYNAGGGAVVSALKRGVPPRQLDQGATKVTYGVNYVVNILATQAKLRGGGGVA